MHVAVMIRFVKLTHSFAKVDLLAPLRALTVGGLLGEMGALRIHIARLYLPSGLPIYEFYWWWQLRVFTLFNPPPSPQALSNSVHLPS